MYYIVPRLVGREWRYAALIKLHFWASAYGVMLMNVIFLPMFLQGMLSMHRRWYDGGQGWNVSAEHIWGLTGFQWNTPISIAAWVMLLLLIAVRIVARKFVVMPR